MSMTVYSAHVYAVSENNKPYFEISFDNEVEPEMVVKKQPKEFMEKYANSDDREELISSAFDGNADWDDEEPYNLKDEVEFSIDWDDSLARKYKKFCNDIKKSKGTKYVLFAVDSNRKYWLDYATYWYDAVIVDFNKKCLYSVEWRGCNVSDSGYGDADPFDRKTAEYLIGMIEKDRIKDIDVGDFELRDRLQGGVKIKEL